MWADDIPDTISHEHNGDTSCAFCVPSQICSWHLECEHEASYVGARDVITRPRSATTTRSA